MFVAKTVREGRFISEEMSSISFFFEETRKRIRALFRAVGFVGEFCETWSALELYRRSAFQFVSTPYLAVDCASKQN